MNGNGNVSILSSQEAVDFVQDVLEIKNVTERLENDRVAFLDQIIVSFQQKMPFQTITNVSRSPKDQRLSTMEDIKSQMFTCQGGLCYDLNIFMKFLLETLGYEAYFIACNIGNSVGSHIATVIRDLEKTGDVHYVDVGVGEPVFKAIPFSFEKESKLYHSSYLSHKFLRSGESYSWLHEVNERYRPLSRDDTVIDGWNTFMVFTLEPKHIRDFYAPVIRHYVTQTPKPKMSFLNTLRSVVYPDQRMVAINGKTLLLEDADGNVCKRKITSKEELLSLYQKYFPQLPIDKVLVGIDKMGYSFDQD